MDGAIKVQVRGQLARVVPARPVNGPTDAALRSPRLPREAHAGPGPAMTALAAITATGRLRSL